MWYHHGARFVSCFPERLHKNTFILASSNVVMLRLFKSGALWLMFQTLDICTYLYRNNRPVSYSVPHELLFITRGYHFESNYSFHCQTQQFQSGLLLWNLRISGVTHAHNLLSRRYTRYNTSLGQQAGSCQKTTFGNCLEGCCHYVSVCMFVSQEGEIRSALEEMGLS